ncbi:hypothetical protein [Methylibium petroleiphilum]|uniref:Nicotinamide riboside transporter PnuC n=1 Tax=Methylibium petroleiphilum (strain ATCC BAA-1232 / LMG 22953 / PM1) TaxID=420662 RepID=A2SN94_METPP|nr:hypothetical protein [Methylibium petroleiphilum]ABM97033.1 hypothetical protein Mpe_B0258 [Methylibium petroleiphilum PM1]
MTYDFVGFLFGVIGAILVALNHPSSSRWGFVFYLGSNAAWIGFALHRGESWLLLQNVLFAVTSLLGLWQWVVKPRLARSRGLRRATVHDVTSVVFNPGVLRRAG